MPGFITQGVSIDQAAFIKFKRDWYLDQISMVRPVEPVLAIAREAQRRGIPMAIASGGGREHVLGAICANGLQSMFGAFICAEVQWHVCSCSSDLLQLLYHGVRHDQHTA